jgi:hypothetical protein
MATRPRLPRPTKGQEEPMLDLKALEETLQKAEKKRTDLRTVPYLELHNLLDDLKDQLDALEALGDRLQRAHDRVEEVVGDMEDAESDYLLDDEYEDEEDE